MRAYSKHYLAVKNNYNEIIPNKYSFNNGKRTIQTERVMDKDTKEVRKSTLVISETATVDIKGMHKHKNATMINILIAFMPEGAPRNLVMTMLYTANKKNIVFDTSEEEEVYAEFVSREYKINVDVIRRTLRKFIELNWIKKLNKYQYMVNPYYSVRNDISTNKISQLQLMWDKLEAGEKIKEPITWDEDRDRLGNSKETIEDIEHMKEFVKRSDREFNELKAIKEKNLKEDIQTIRSNMDQYEELLKSFRLKFNYVGKLTVKQRTHLANYVRRGFKENWKEFRYVPPIKLDRTYKPLFELDIH